MASLVKKFLVFMGLAVLVGLVGFVGLLYVNAASNKQARQATQADMMRPVLEWGRLAPFPKSAKNLKITTEGGMFTRGFHASFTAPPADVKRWLQTSPGTRDVKPEPNTQEIRRYQISPGGGANSASVTVENGTLVRVYVSWS